MSKPFVTIGRRGEAPLDPNIGIVSVELHRELNRIPEARLSLSDDHGADQAFEMSATPLFEPGEVLSIALERQGASPAVFEGFVTRKRVEAQRGVRLFHVELKDRAFALTRLRKSAIFRGQTDGAVFRSLIHAAGLHVGEVNREGEMFEHEELVQYYSSDWDFMVTRAEAQGLAVDVHQGEVSFRALELEEQATLRVDFGGISQVRELELDIDASEQLAAVKGLAWDLESQALTQRATSRTVKSGHLDVDRVSKDLGAEEYTLLHPAPLSRRELELWVDGRLRRNRLALFRGRIVLNGSPERRPLETIELAGISEGFDGRALVSGVVHRYNEEGWSTELVLGLPPKLFAEEPGIVDIPAAGLLPPIMSLQVGTVAASEEDPSNEYRIKVRLPGLAETEGFLWARVARPEAGRERGIVFWPEPGDEVVLGFLANDPRQAIVLGSLHSASRPPPSQVAAPTVDQSRRGIVTRAGSMISFDDDKHVVTVETPNANRIVLDDDSEAISIEDKHGNRVDMTSEGITLSSVRDLVIKAIGTITIKGSSVDVQ